MVASMTAGMLDTDKVKSLTFMALVMWWCPIPTACGTSQKDDMGKIYDKLMKADVLVIASSVYFYGLSAHLRIGRIAFQEFTGKRDWA